MALIGCSVIPQWALGCLMAAAICGLYRVWRWLSVIWGCRAGEGPPRHYYHSNCSLEKLTPCITNCSWRAGVLIMWHSSANCHHFIASLHCFSFFKISESMTFPFSCDEIEISMRLLVELCTWDPLTNPHNPVSTSDTPPSLVMERFTSALRSRLNPARPFCDCKAIFFCKGNKQSRVFYLKCPSS